MEEPYVPFYKPYGMSDEEYAHEVGQANRKLAEWESNNQIHSLEKTLADLTIENQRLRDDFSKWTPEEIEQENERDLTEMAHFYGGWEELQKVVQRMKDNADEEAGERAMNEPGAWEGGFADNH